MAAGSSKDAWNQRSAMLRAEIEEFLGNERCNTLKVQVGPKQNSDQIIAASHEFSPQKVAKEANLPLF